MADWNVVYVLTNSAMPGLVKIGYTTQDDANARLSQLYTTGVPVPFELNYACKVQNVVEVERALHVAFAPHRINPKREFFKIDPEQAIAILKLLHMEDATAEIERQPSTIDQESIIAAAQFKAKRPNMNFSEMGIHYGAELHSIHGAAIAYVLGAKKVCFNDEEMSLTAATRLILGIEHSVQPSPHWTYQGRLLKSIYEETYADISE